MKVLILAEQCNSEWASLPFFSYELAKATADQVDVVVVTHIRNKPAIDRTGFGRAQVEYVDNEYIAAPLYKLANLFRRLKLGNWMMGMALSYPSYIAFEYEVWKKYKQRLADNEFALIHRISPVSPTLPSPLASWTTVPFILGPINGGLGWPDTFVNELKKEKEFIIYFRQLYRLLPYYHATFKHVKRVLAAFKHVERDIPEYALGLVERFDELGINPDVFNADNRLNSSEQCHFLFVGRLVPYKNADVAVRAFLADKNLYENHRLTIVGDGPEMQSLQNIISKHSAISQNIALVGWKSAAEISALLKAAQVFVFPTIREVGGNVLVEAMACGLPCIVPDYGGPSELVNQETGIKLKLTDKPNLISAVTSAMLELANNHEQRNAKSIKAAEFAKQHYTWESKARQLKSIYQRLLNVAD
ncbi:glycosyltransferase family 4 protein [Methylomonas sp. AM2-LC]|uniref:glycosyltransferase family 4 protein n=1 Tax=Methylomonas sp. AM2-LC TaxID=3153301 RepID=UPI0032645425